MNYTHGVTQWLMVGALSIAGTITCMDQPKKDGEERRVTLLQAFDYNVFDKLSEQNKLLANQPKEACALALKTSIAFRDAVDERKKKSWVVKSSEDLVEKYEKQCPYFGVVSCLKVFSWEEQPVIMDNFTSHAAQLIIERAREVRGRHVHVYGLTQASELSTLIIFAKVLKKCPTLQLKLINAPFSYYAYLEKIDEKSKAKVNSHLTGWIQEHYLSGKTMQFDHVLPSTRQDRIVNIDVVYAIDETNGNNREIFDGLCNLAKQKGLRFSGLMMHTTSRGVELDERGILLKKASVDTALPTNQPPSNPSLNPLPSGNPPLYGADVSPSAPPMEPAKKE